jgi:hypothetical protein
MVKLDLDLLDRCFVDGLDLEKHWRLNVLPTNNQTLDQKHIYE